MKCFMNHNTFPRVTQKILTRLTETFHWLETDQFNSKLSKNIFFEKKVQLNVWKNLQENQIHGSHLKGLRVSLTVNINWRSAYNSSKLFDRMLSKKSCI